MCSIIHVEYFCTAAVSQQLSHDLYTLIMALPALPLTPTAGYWDQSDEQGDRRIAGESVVPHLTLNE